MRGQCRGILLNFLRSWHLEVTEAVSDPEVEGDEESVSQQTTFFIFFFLSPLRCDLTWGGESSLPLVPNSLDGAFPWLVAISISLLADPPNITLSGQTLMKYQALIPIESRLEGGEQAKPINFEYNIHPGSGLEINNNEYGVRKIVLLAMSFSINADDFGS